MLELHRRPRFAEHVGVGVRRHVDLGGGFRPGELRRRFGLRTFAMPAGRQGAGRGVDGEPDEHGLGIHAGWAETSMMLHLRPDLVHMDKAVASVADSVADAEHVGFADTVRFGWLSTDFAESGVIGDPTGADASIGAKLFDERVENLVAALPEIATFDPGRVGR